MNDGIKKTILCILLGMQWTNGGGADDQVQHEQENHQLELEQLVDVLGFQLFALNRQMHPREDNLQILHLLENMGARDRELHPSLKQIKRQSPQTTKSIIDKAKELFRLSRCVDRMIDAAGHSIKRFGCPKCLFIQFIIQVLDFNVKILPHIVNEVLDITLSDFPQYTLTMEEKDFILGYFGVNQIDDEQFSQFNLSLLSELQTLKENGEHGTVRLFLEQLADTCDKFNKAIKTELVGHLGFDLFALEFKRNNAEQDLANLGTEIVNLLASIQERYIDQSLLAIILEKILKSEILTKIANMTDLNISKLSDLLRRTESFNTDQIIHGQLLMLIEVTFMPNRVNREQMKGIIANALRNAIKDMREGAEFEDIPLPADVRNKISQHILKFYEGYKSQQEAISGLYELREKIGKQSSEAQGLIKNKAKSLSQISMTAENMCRLGVKFIRECGCPRDLFIKFIIEIAAFNGMISKCIDDDTVANFSELVDKTSELFGDNGLTRVEKDDVLQQFNDAKPSATPEEFSISELYKLLETLTTELSGLGEDLQGLDKAVQVEYMKRILFILQAFNSLFNETITDCLTSSPL